MACALLLLAGFIVATALAWHPAMDPVGAPSRESFNRAQVLHGAQLAEIGNCAGCHTAQSGKPFAGGLAMATPFGTVYSTNITPDVDTGIGAWSEAAFRRAMQQGIARDGHQLYPAFPYPYFSRVSGDDIAALYAYFMTRDAIRQPAPDNRLIFPLGFRPLVAGWNLLFLRNEPPAQPPGHSAEWNRGAYLAQGLGHCSACHTPRNVLGAEEQRRYLDGGEAEGWYAPALNARSPSPQPWTVEQLDAYLHTGIAANHAIAGGPMQSVVQRLGRVEDSDVRAIAAYIQSMQGTPTPQRQALSDASRARARLASLSVVTPSAGPTDQNEAQRLQIGAALYAGFCARCHDAGREVGSGGALQLPLAIAVYDPDPRSLIRIVRQGIYPPTGARGRWMPGFAGALDDAQTVALLAYLRRYAADAPPWPDLSSAVQKASTP